MDIRNDCMKRPLKIPRSALLSKISPQIHLHAAQRLHQRTELLSLFVLSLFRRSLGSFSLFAQPFPFLFPLLLLFRLFLSQHSTAHLLFATRFPAPQFSAVSMQNLDLKHPHHALFWTVHLPAQALAVSSAGQSQFSSSAQQSPSRNADKARPNRAYHHPPPTDTYIEGS